MAYPISSPGEAPLDVQMGAADAAGAAFQAALVGHANAVFFQPVHICRADVETGLFDTFFHAQSAIDDAQVGFLIHPKPI